jgi:hypothetical protein
MKLLFRISLTLALLAVAPWAQARTIELTDHDCDRIAMIAPQAPRAGWVMYESAGGEYNTVYSDLRNDRALLIRYPLDRIPEGQRITKAEWILPVNLVSPGGEYRLYVRRIIGSWGFGVCHDFRTTRPSPIAWNVPGAKGAATDRTAEPSAIVRVSGPSSPIINVTEDVELWYTGSSNNNGWIVTMEDPDSLVRLNSPVWSGQGGWRLRITYEPE